MTSSSFSGFLSDLSKAGFQTDGISFINFNSKIFTFYLAKTENRTKKALTQPS